MTASTEERALVETDDSSEPALGVASAPPEPPRQDGLAQLLDHLVESNASDLFVKVGSSPRLRVEGRLRSTPFAAPEPGHIERLVASMLPQGKSDELALDGEVEFAMGISGLGRFRVHVYRQRGSLAVVFRRVLPGIPSWEQLGLPPVIDRLGSEGGGLVLVTGPSGSGKTTTLNAIIDHINTNRAAHVVTIEDPVEYLHTDKLSLISQREVGTDTASLAEGMRRALRQGPDVLVASHLPDLVSIRSAMDAAATGVLVLATMPTTSASETVSRIVEHFALDDQRQVRHQLAGVLRGVLSQRLLPRADGKGRVAAVESLINTHKVSECIDRPECSADLAALIADGRYHGMQTHDQALFELARDGLVALSDVLAAADSAEDLRIELQQAGLAPPH